MLHGSDSCVHRRRRMELQDIYSYQEVHEGCETDGEFTTFLRPDKDVMVEGVRKDDLLCRGLPRQVQAQAGRWQVLDPCPAFLARPDQLLPEFGDDRPRVDTTGLLDLVPHPLRGVFLFTGETLQFLEVGPRVHRKSRIG